MVVDGRMDEWLGMLKTCKKEQPQLVAYKDSYKCINKANYIFSMDRGSNLGTNNECEMVTGSVLTKQHEEFNEMVI